MSDLSKAQIEMIVELAVAKTMSSAEFKELVNVHCNERLSAMGVDWKSPEGVREFIEDQMYLRSLRTASERIRKVGLTTVVGIIVTSVLGALWLGFQMLLTGRSLP